MAAQRYATSAKRLINRSGQTCTIYPVSNGVYNPVTHEISNTEGPGVTLKAYHAPTEFRDSQNPSLVGKTLQTFFIATLDLPTKPGTGDRIVSPFGTFRVAMVRSHNYSDGAAFWRVIAVAA